MAAVRAVVQLAAVSLLITAIVASLRATAGFSAVMCVVATATSGRRVTGGDRGWWTGATILAGSAPVVGGPLVAGLVSARGIAITPVAGILIGGR